jgi:DNA-binding XRE family transcriptional regulator
MLHPQPAKVELVRRGLRQNAVADAIGVPRPTLNQVLNRRLAASQRIKNRLAEYLDLPIEDLFDCPEVAA